MNNCQYALTIYGVTLFELFSRGVPCVVFSPYGDRDDLEMKALRSEGVARVEHDAPAAIAALQEIMSLPEAASRLSSSGQLKVDGRGVQRLADEIQALLEDND